MDHLTVAQALREFYGKEAIGDEAFERRINYFSVGLIRVPFPNFGLRRKLIYLHDINHLLTGYDTSKIGEGEVAAYELASGFPPHCWIGYFYAPFALIGGIVLNPSRIRKAFRRGLGAKNACHSPLTKEQLLEITLGELKQRLKVQTLG